MTGNLNADLDGPGQANMLLIGGRLQSERERLRLSLRDAARLMGLDENTLAGWERSDNTKSTTALTLLGHAGADVLFIITGTRNDVGKANGETAANRFREALAALPGDERRRLLLYLVSDELNYVTTRR